MSEKTPNTAAMPPQKSRHIIISIFGFSLALFGLLYGIYAEEMLSKFLEHYITLRPDSDIYHMWRKPPLEITLDMYLFNWTNSEEFYNLSTKPILKECGPYRFTEKQQKINIKWHPENSSVTYQRQSFFYFDAAGSKGRLDDNIVTVNSMAVGAAARSRNWDFMRRTLLEIALQAYGNKITIKKTAEELLFKGYNDEMLSLSRMLPSAITEVYTGVIDKIGYAYGHNGTFDFSPIYNIHTGADDIRKLGKVNTANYRKTSPHFSGECAKVHGSPGDFHPPYLQKNGNISIYVPVFCRPITLDYVETVVVDGMTGYKYHGGERLMDNGTLYPENVCYCDGKCIPSGVFNVTSCWYDTPLYISYPHFYKADPYYGDQLEGLTPNKEQHELYQILEPKTGLALDMAVRVQGNVLVEPMMHSRTFRKVRKLYFPLIWVEYKTHITPDKVAQWNLFLSLILACQIFGGICFITGVIMLLWHPVLNRLNQHYTLEIKDLKDKSDHLAHKKSKDIKKKVKEYSPLLQRADRSANELIKSLSIESGNTEMTLSSSLTDSHHSSISLSLKS